ncbi:acyltransferase family protein [Chryseosolibacter indicus]|uniref:Acyltransferase n=1 Tax=Chryseosolibacter indicus TaxID=2782351 RepID=A0ABS5VTU0_9BACT|nr:acyltransferase [Chryseosolibacter indicus]MBT1704844.1 acyltransferase [Chryseosolibacter indicus]
MNNNSLTTKPHYKILDGLRGVAALMVVLFHIFEAHATSHLDQLINHGYLAVDFFFLLSGFVIGYAYDDRWNNITTLEFFKRRLIRLQPMVVMGMLVGAICFYFQGSVLWPGISEVPLWSMLLIMFIGFTLLPVPPSMDIRGWAEMHPLNGPAWSLFFEYFANILYAIGVRKFSKPALSVLVFISAVALIHLAVTSPAGDVIGGWSIDPTQLYIGLTRLMYPFFAGLLLSRTVKLTFINNAFLWCSLLVIIVLSFPRIGGSEHLWMNGLYDSLSIILIFPLLIYLGASGDVKGKYADKLCKFLGDVSYPIYITHYPIVYIYTGWVYDGRLKIKETYPIAILAFISCIALAYAALKLYDEPTRKWLGKKVLLKPTASA